MSKSLKLQQLSKEIEEGLDYNGLIQLRKKVYNVKVEMYSDEWYEKRMLLDCIKEFLDESKPTKEQKEQEVLKKFEELGYEILDNDLYLVILKNDKQFIIDKKLKSYFVSTWNNEHNKYSITLQEHQLLTELFKCWRWFDEQ